MRGIDLGDVAFGLNADTAGLDRALNKLRAFGQEVNKVAKSTEEGASALTAALSRQEKLIASSFQKVVDLQQQIRASGAPTQHLTMLTTTFRSLTDNLSQGAVASHEYSRAQTQVAARLSESRRALAAWTAENQRAMSIEKAWTLAKIEDDRRTQALGRMQSQAIGVDSSRTQTFGRLQSQAQGVDEARTRRLALMQMQAQAEDALRSQGKWHEALHNLGRAVVLIEGPLSGLGARMTVLSALFESSAMKMALFVAGTAAVGAGLAYSATAAIKATIQWQQWQASMVAASGAHVLVGEDMKYIIGVSRDFGQSIEATLPAWANFATAARLSGMTLKEQKTVFESFMTAGSALHWNTEKIGRAFLALEQIMSKGAPQMQEVRLQLGQVLPGAFALAARGMKMTTDELSKAMEQGKIKAKEFVLAMSDAVAMEYRAASQSGRQSITSDIQRFHIETFMLARSFDEATRASGAFHAVLRGTNNVIQFAADNMGKFVLGIQAAGFGLAALFAPTIVAGIAAVARGIYGAAAAMLAFGAASATNPFLAVVTVLLRIAAAVGIGVTAYEILNKKQDEILEGAQRYGDELKKTVKQAQDVGSIDAEIKERMSATHKQQLNELDEQIRKQEEVKNAYAMRAAAEKDAAAVLAEANKKIPKQYRGILKPDVQIQIDLPPGPSKEAYQQAVEAHKKYLEQKQMLEDQWNKLNAIKVAPGSTQKEKDEKAVRDFLDGLEVQMEHLNDSGSKYLHILAQAEKFALKNADKLGGYGSDKMVEFLNTVEQKARKAKEQEEKLHEAHRKNAEFDTQLKESDDAQSALNALAKTQRESALQLQHETDLIGLNTQERELAIAVWQRQVGAREALHKANSIANDSDRAAALEQLDRIREMDKEYLEMLRRRQEAERAYSMSLGAYMKQGAEAAQKAFSDFFFDFMQGKLNDLAGNFKKMIDRMVADAAAARLANYLFGDMGASSKTGSFGGVVGGFIQNNDFLRGFFSPGFGDKAGLAAGVPQYAEGSDYVPQTGLALVHQGERITPAHENATGQWGGGGMTNYFNFTLAAPADRRTQEQIAASVGVSIRRAISRNR